MSVMKLPTKEILEIIIYFFWPAEGSNEAVASSIFSLQCRADIFDASIVLRYL